MFVDIFNNQLFFCEQIANFWILFNFYSLFQFLATRFLCYFPQHCLYFLPLPQGHKSLRPIFFFSLTFGVLFKASFPSLVCPFGACFGAIVCLISTFIKKLVILPSILSCIFSNISYPSKA